MFNAAKISASFAVAAVASPLPAVALGLTITTGSSLLVTIGLAVLVALLWLIHAIHAGHNTTRRHCADLCDRLEGVVKGALDEQERRNQEALDTAKVIRAGYGPQLPGARTLYPVKTS